MGKSWEKLESDQIFRNKLKCESDLMFRKKGNVFLFGHEFVVRHWVIRTLM